MNKVEVCISDHEFLNALAVLTSMSETVYRVDKSASNKLLLNYKNFVYIEQNLSLTD